MYLQWSSIWRTIKLCSERKKESNKFPEFEFGKYDIHNKLRCEAIFEKTFVSPEVYHDLYREVWHGKAGIPVVGHVLTCIPVIPHLMALPREKWNLSVFGWIQLGLLPVLPPPAMHSCLGSLHDRDYEQQEGFLSMFSQTCECVPFDYSLHCAKGLKQSLWEEGCCDKTGIVTLTPHILSQSVCLMSW